ncbi:hypothetical protein [Azospirillum soli]|uniref:hypothetical protein n=1 Tax=Azospirillum soli TaxID=1304799 RepID=UPI001AE71F15|nr:hypothetical protein [Azospirillum soli]MBP2316350.1 hypothetical protein [Azospirillum soli]
MTNSSEYDAALRRRGSLTVWFTEDANTAWKTASRASGGAIRLLVDSTGLKLCGPGEFMGN